ncbi:urokinase plasminogen activator surface receptor-like isoform X1 [Hemibagrus wyckioides]|uniref:urokinase plasminogen activator surface receptor-like isoform X1 n=1 Tax=Hemibagrus wyckioides TaxID=337641 RepID=UPI00266C2F1E|nr:urokinase plasminogen activator surface receptor-like isoform X1 [Hemibagrus wyckioides]
MKFLLTLLLISVLFSQVLSLMCQECFSEQCGQKNCPDQCTSLTLYVVASGKNVTSVIKTCAIPEMCSPGSINLGEVVMTSNAMCCSSTLCNIETLPVLPLPQPNGKMCYSCKNNDCSQTVDCAGNEDRCITETATLLGMKVTMKGCVAKAFCSSNELLNPLGNDTINVQCCEGNLCNGVDSFTPSFFLMIISLLFSILFY